MMIRGLDSLKLIFALVVGLALTGCVPVETRPTLNEARGGRNQVSMPGDRDLQPGELRAEVLEVIPARSEIRVRTDDGREHIMTYNTNRTTVKYHGWDYRVENLEAGDIVAIQTAPRDGNYIDTVRVQEPVQARFQVLRLPSHCLRGPISSKAPWKGFNTTKAYLM
jgi:hypothetical protein